MDLRKLVSFCSLLLLILGLSLVLWTWSSKVTLAKESRLPQACGCTADNASPEDYARSIEKALASKKLAGGKT